MPSSYPGAFDNFDTDHSDDPTRLVRLDFDPAVDAINKIEAELGTNPSGAASTVDDRIAALEGAGGWSPGLGFGDNIVAPIHPFLLATGAVAITRWSSVQVVVPKDGTLTDLAVGIYDPHGSTGHIDVGVYDPTTPTWSLFYSTGSILCPPQAGWQIVGDPALSVTAGQRLVFAISTDDAAIVIMRHANTLFEGSKYQLPSVFVPAGMSTKMVGVQNGGFPLPSTWNDSDASIMGSMFALIARVA